jgi:hypothetical protein
LRIEKVEIVEKSVMMIFSNMGHLSKGEAQG